MSMTALSMPARSLAEGEEVGAAVNPFTEAMSNVFLFLLIFGMSATVDVENVARQLKNKFAIATGCAMQFLIMPLLGYLAVIGLKSHGLNEAMGITLLIVTASPGGSFSNWWCSTFNADLALSVAMTTFSTLLSVFFLPANLSLYAHAAFGQNGDLMNNIDFTAIFISLAIVVTAILSGLVFSYKCRSPKVKKVANALGSVSGVCLIMFSILLSGSGGEEETHTLWAQDWSFYVGVMMPCVLGLAVANVISLAARLKKPECITLSVECCYQNTGIATSAAVGLFDDPHQRAQALAVPLFYGLVEAVIVTLYCIVAWKMGWSKAPKDENFCVACARSYEVVSVEMMEDVGSKKCELELEEEDPEVVKPLAQDGSTQIT